MITSILLLFILRVIRIFEGKIIIKKKEEKNVDEDSPIDGIERSAVSILDPHRD